MKGYWARNSWAEGVGGRYQTHLADERGSAAFVDRGKPWCPAVATPKSCVPFEV